MTRRGQPLPKPPGSNIGYHIQYEELKVARHWALTPTQWYQEPRWSRAAMVAYTRTANAIEYWLDEDAAERIRRAQPPKAKKLK